MDPWDFLEEVNVMERWGADQRAAVTSTKWSERRDGLQSLVDLIDKNPRLYSKTTTVYGEIVDELKKILLKDSNINVVAVAIKLVGALARGLRRQFGGFVGMIWSPLLDKAKDKKAIVKEALPGCLDAVAATCSLDRISGPLLEAMQKPSPESKLLLDSFIYRLLLTIPSASSALPFLKEITPVLVKHASDPDASVREGACVALGGMRRLMGVAMDGMMGEVKGDAGKMAKITAAAEKATAEVAEAEEERRKGGGGERGETSGDGPSGSGEGGEEEEEGGAAAAAVAADPWMLMEAVELGSVMDKNFSTQLAEKKWQERKEALDGLEKVLLEKKRLQLTPDVGPVVSAVNKVLEKDVNINVAAAAAACLTAMAAALRTDFAAFAPKVIAVCTDKFKEKKTVVRERVVECVDAAACTVSMDAFIEEMLAGLAKTNPASRSQTALFIARLLSLHSPSTLPREAARAVAAGLVKLSSDPDAECRDAAFAALAALLRVVGEGVGRGMMGEVEEDRIRMGKIEKLRDDLIAERGQATASVEMRRLHGEGVKPKPATRPAAAAAAPAAKKPVAVRPTAAAAAPRPAAPAANVPRKTPASAPIRVAPTAAGARPSTTSAAAAARVAATPTRPLSRAGGSGKTTPLRGSRENVSIGGRGPLTLEGAAFLTNPEKNKTTRLAEHRPSTAADLVRSAAGCCSPALLQLLQADGVEGINMMMNFIEQQQQPVLADHSDLLCRWLALRLAATSTPPTLLQRLLPTTAKVIGDLGQLTEQEMAIVLPAAVSKIGDTREVIRSDARALAFSLVESQGAAAVIPYLIEGLRGKIIRQKMDTLSIIGTLASKDSTLLGSCSAGTIKALLPSMLECLSDRDALTRTAALNACIGVEGQMRERAEWKSAVSKLAPKERKLLEERLEKAASGVMPAPRMLAPMPRPTVQPPSSSSSLPPRPISSGGLPRPTPSVLPGSRLPRPGSGFTKK